MIEDGSKGLSSTSSNIAALENMHNLLLEALRHREQEIVRYLAILGPALGGFVWLLHSGSDKTNEFAVGTVGVLFLLLLGAIYSLALGYNYRYITLELAKLESLLGIRSAMLEGWPRCPKDFITRYRLCCRIPWCTPPEVIKVFWLAFLAGIIGVMITAYIFKLEAHTITTAGVICLFIGLLSPIHFGKKLHKKIKKELESWKKGGWKI